MNIVLNALADLPLDLFDYCRTFLFAPFRIWDLQDGQEDLSIDVIGMAQHAIKLERRIAALEQALRERA